MSFEIGPQAAVAAHASVARASMTANVLKRLHIVRGEGFGQDGFRHAQAMTDVTQAAVGWATARVTTGVHPITL
jgi:hypothetical protein